MSPQRSHAGPRAAALAVFARVTGRRPSRNVAVLAVLGVAATVLVASPAGAVAGSAPGAVVATGASTGTVTAHVTLDGGGAAGYGCLDVSTRDYSSSGFQCGTGDISVPGLAPGDYLVGFTHFENGVDEWYRDAASRSAATPVSVVAGVTSDISATLAVGATIRGTVTLADGSAPSWGSAEAYDAEGRQVRLGTVGAAGAYSIGGLAPGSYYVRFSNFAGAPVTFVGGGDRADATAVPVTSGSTTTLNYQLPEPATLEVTLDASALHAPALSGPSVVALTSSGDFLGSAEHDGQTGAFAFDALPEGDVYLRVAPSADHSFARVHYDGGVNSLGDATPVRVTAGATSSTTFALRAVGALTGSVTRFNDRLAADPALERDVVVYSQERASGAWLPLECTECGGAVEPLATVVTDAAGRFTVDDLLVGDYKVGFRDHLDNAAYQPPPTDFRSDPVIFYGGADLASATIVHVTAGATVPGVSAVLQPVAGPPYVALGWGGGPLTCVDGHVVGAEFGWGYDSTSAGLDPAVEEQVSRDGIASVTLTQGGHPVTGNHDLVAGDLVITVVVKDGYQYDPARLADPGTTVNGRAVSFTWTIPPYVGPCAPVTPPSPDAAIRAYVTKVYSDLFHRAPDAPGLAAWTSALRSGTPYGEVANGITASPEYRSRLIAGTYQRYLGRAPEATGLAAWLVAMNTGTHIEQMQAGFIASDEFYARGGGNDRGWVALLYQSVLGRSPASGEVDAWVAGLRGGASRATVARGFLYSSEHLTAVVDAQYVDLLRRHLDPTGRATWVGLIQAGHRDEEIIAAIVASAEYRAKV